MITIRELKDYIARYEEAGWLSDDSPVVLGLQSGPHEAATVGIGKAPNISPLRALRIGVEMRAAKALTTTGLEEGHPTTNEGDIPMTPDAKSPPHYFPVLRYFHYRHLPERLQEVSAPFYDLAVTVATAPTNDLAETATALRKLLEAKDAAVRAMLPGEQDRAQSGAST